MRVIAFSRTCLLALGFAAVAGAAPITNPAFPGVVCETIQVPMRDGTLLATDKYSPEGGSGQYPVIMARSPLQPGERRRLFPGTWAPSSRGSRSMGTSPGPGMPGNEPVAGALPGNGAGGPGWIRRDRVGGTQSWSTGKVGTTSGSYLGLTHGSRRSTIRRTWRRSPRKSPPPTTTTTGSTSNGVFDLWFGMSWPARSGSSDQMIRAASRKGCREEETIDQLSANWNDKLNANLASKWVWQLPIDRVRSRP